ncbi:MAG: UbiX family flavin prenyltransferase, partial [bacterium]
MKKYIVGITGASGIIIGIRLIEELVQREFSVIGIITDNASKVIEHEINNKFKLNEKAEYFQEHDATAPMNSSSYLVDGMIIAPCSMKTLAAIAHGYTFNLISRAADNQLRTNRSLILVPRETPLSVSHLENMLKLKQA